MRFLNKCHYFAKGILHRMTRSKRCPCCGAIDSATVDRKMVYTLECCHECSLLYRYPGDSKQELISFYQDAYRKPGITTDLPDERALVDLKATNFANTVRDIAPALKIFEAIGVKPGAKVLDFGASWGYQTYQFRQHGFQAEAYEVSVPRAHEGRRLGLGNYNRSQQTRIEFRRGLLEPCYRTRKESKGFTETAADEVAAWGSRDLHHAKRE